MTWKKFLYNSAHDHQVPLLEIQDHLEREGSQSSSLHLMGPDFEAVISLLTLDVLDGTAPAGVLRHARKWINDNKEELLKQWQTLHG